MPFQGAVRLGLFEHAYPKHDLTAVGELDGVAKQIIENLTDAYRVAANPVRQLGIYAGIKTQTFAAGKSTVGAHGFFGDIQGAKALNVDGHLPGFNLGDIQHIAD